MGYRGLLFTLCFRICFPLAECWHRLFQHSETLLHRARFATALELHHLLSLSLPTQGLLLGTQLLDSFVSVRPEKTQHELGNLLIVGPTRCGKGLLAVSQLLSWQSSVVVNDIKGDLFTQTAGYRSTFSDVYVIDPQGIGHSFDPLLGKQTEDQFYSAASHLLFEANEGEGRIFTQRATTMLTQIFAAARREGSPALAYTRQLIRQGLPAAAARLNTVSPALATQFLGTSFAEANLSDRFLLSAWGTLLARLYPLLTETVVRSLTRSDFTPAQIMRSSRPVSVYIRWKEQDLLALSPLVRLFWGSLIDELITTYDSSQGQGCKPVLLLIDEAGRTAIPMLADQATTVVGRGIYLWVAIQSLAQLAVVYGKERSQVLRDNMATQLYYRPLDLTTAQHIEDRLGQVSAYAHSETLKEGTATSEGHAERPIPLLTAQEIMQLPDEAVICFHRQFPPFQLNRADWQHQSLLRQRRRLSAPALPQLPPLPVIPTAAVHPHPSPFPTGYIDPERKKAGSQQI
jgi:type IV secretion system protein VirD4